MRKGMLYPHNVLEGFGNGAILDLRVRMANDFIKSPAFSGLLVNAVVEKEANAAPELIARLALDIAEELTAIAEARGWVAPLPEGGELPQFLRDQAKASSSYNVLQQLEGARFAASEQNRVLPPAPGFDPKKH